ncbi:MAG: nitrilase family protein [Bacteroidales bacterium]|nr:nitrilase family protein [Bacteroidales bacterium]
MKITVCSLNIAWENKDLNFRKIESLMSSIEDPGDLFVLPEMFSTGFTMNTFLAEDAAGETLKWMLSFAQKHNIALLGSIPYSQNGRNFFNRAYFVKPDGTWSVYDKRHLFRMGDENSHYTRGDEKCIVEYKGVKIAINVCYDIRFPVWSRNIGNKYDVLINIANFPQVRINAIEPLVRARAIENIAYAIFANRDGNDPKCTYSPSSQIYNFKGEPVSQEMYIEDCEGKKTQILQCCIDLDSLYDFRYKFPTWMDADTFNVIV